MSAIPKLEWREIPDGLESGIYRITWEIRGFDSFHTLHTTIDREYFGNFRTTEQAKAVCQAHADNLRADKMIAETRREK